MFSSKLLLFKFKFKCIRLGNCFISSPKWFIFYLLSASIFSYKSNSRYFKLLDYCLMPSYKYSIFNSFNPKNCYIITNQEITNFLVIISNTLIIISYYLLQFQDQKRINSVLNATNYLVAILNILLVFLNFKGALLDNYLLN